MPRVGAQTFPYTRKGIAEAKATAKSTGTKIVAARSYKDVAKQQSARAKAKAAGNVPDGDAEDKLDGGVDEVAEEAAELTKGAAKKPAMKK